MNKLYIFKVFDEDHNPSAPTVPKKVRSRIAGMSPQMEYLLRDDDEDDNTVDNNTNAVIVTTDINNTKEASDDGENN